MDSEDIGDCCDCEVHGLVPSSVSIPICFSFDEGVATAGGAVPFPSSPPTATPIPGGGGGIVA